MEKKKKVALALLFAAVFFMFGNIFAYFLLRGSDLIPTRTGFKNPTGAPHIEGPSGPPPGQNSQTSAATR